MLKTFIICDECGKQIELEEFNDLNYGTDAGWVIKNPSVVYVLCPECNEKEAK